MNVTFTSGDKRMIRSVINYLFNAQLTSDNINRHIQYLKNKYRNVNIESNKVHKSTLSRGTVTNICVKLKK